MARIVKLYSDEALELLREASQHIEKKSSSSHQRTDGSSTFDSTAVLPFNSDSEESEGKPWLSDDEHEASSSSSEEEEEEELQGTDGGSGENSSGSPKEDQHLLLPPTDDESKSKKESTTPKHTRKTREKKTMKENKYLVKQSAMIPRLSFALNDDGLTLEAPTLVLTRKQTQFDHAAVCRSYLKVVTDMVTLDKPIVLLLLKSGRFAGGVFRKDKCVAHKAHQRYTIRKKQGRAQSSLDSSKQKANSMGAQLRRAEEIALREDVMSTLREWQPYIENASHVLISCPSTMKKDLFVEGVLDRRDERLRKIPLDVGRPTYETVCTVYDILMDMTVREVEIEETDSNKMPMAAESIDTSKTEEQPPENPKLESSVEIKALSPLHLAAATGDLTALKEILKHHHECKLETIHDRAGPEEMTPLHFAAASTNENPSSDDSLLVDQKVAAECVSILLEQFGANPCLVDGRNRPPYFLASNEKVRNAFRTARANLGEEAWAWDLDAKVGPPLDDEALARKQDKAAEKKRRQRARQKERKAKERAEKEKAEKLQKEQDEQRKKAEDAKRVRDGLLPKAKGEKNVCDFCQKKMKGRRSQMFHRLDYEYCSSDCVSKHKRELMAAAAAARLGG